MTTSRSNPSGSRPEAKKTSLPGVLNALRIAGRDRRLWPVHRREILKMIEEVEDMAVEHDKYVECQDFGQPIPPEARGGGE